MAETDQNVIRIPPQKYIHILDNNSNLTKLVEGPSTYVKQTHETLVEGKIQNMVCLKPRTYCRINNPVLRDGKGQVCMTSFGQVEVKYGEYEYRTQEQYSEPFSLYPGEVNQGGQQNLLVVLKNKAIKLQAERNINSMLAGEEWLVNGPITYLPEVGVKVVGEQTTYMIEKDHAIQLKATLPGICARGVQRYPGQYWMVREKGLYIPSAIEEVIKLVSPIVLTEKRALHLKAKNTFTDIYNIKRNAGDQWLVTNQMTDSHLEDVDELIENSNVKDIILFQNQYCVVLNPVDSTGKNMWGKKQLRKGERQFFLQPFEQLENGIQEMELLTEDEALLLIANQDFTDDQKVLRKSGIRWMIQGPRQYIPPIEVNIIEKRKSIPLDENEGIYIRNNDSGEVTVIKGQTYLLKAHEQLYEKEIDPVVEELIMKANAGMAYVSGQSGQSQSIKFQARDKTRLVTFKAAHNSAVQLYDYKTKKNRIVFGPDLVQLGPDEHFTLLQLSGGKPKVEKQIQTLSLQLGPDFMTDVVIIETSDHARVSLELTYSWQFQQPQNNDDCVKLFNVKDFVGDACKGIASRIRGNLSAIPFEVLHYNSSQKIKEAVFGIDKVTNQLRKELVFKSNNLVISSVDIKNMEITDPKTRQYLQQSMNLSIEIQSKSQEATSRHQAAKLDQEAKGQLERMKLEDLAKAEESQIKLLKLQAESNYVQISGEAIANARAEAESEEIQANAELKNAQLRAQAEMIELEQELDDIKSKNDLEVDQIQKMNQLEINKKASLSQIETQKFVQIVNAIGQDTLIAISKAGPEMKAKLLNGLGLKGFLVTDGKNPINLFNTANGFIQKQ